MRKTFNSFCQTTSLHGYGYLGNNDSNILKTVWLFVILVMTGLGIFFLSINTMEFVETKMTTNIESSSTPLSVNIFSLFLPCRYF